MTYLLKIIHVSLLASVKFMFTPMYAHLIELDYFETLIAMISGGVGGFFFFYYITSFLINRSSQISPYVRILFPERIRIVIRNYRHKRKIKRDNKPIFTRRNKLLVRLIRNYGLIALVILTPTFLSIPLGAVLLRKYYPKHKYAVIITVFAIITAGIVETSGYWFLWGDL